MIGGHVLLAASDIPAAPVVLVMGFAVILATLGHATKSRGTTIMGIALLFLATAAMLLGAFAAYQDDSSDPRKEKPPSQPSF
jgi:Na+/phosphate symporter